MSFIPIPTSNTLFIIYHFLGILALYDSSESMGPRSTQKGTMAEVRMLKITNMTEFSCVFTVLFSHRALLCVQLLSLLLQLLLLSLSSSLLLLFLLSPLSLFSFFVVCFCKMIFCLYGRMHI